MFVPLAPTFQPNDVVWLFNPTRKVGVCSKLQPKWIGPCLVVKAIDILTYVVKKSARDVPKIYHIDKIQPYRGNTLPTWIRKHKQE